MLKNLSQSKLLKAFGFFLFVASIFYLAKVVSKLELSFSDFFLIAKDNPFVLISCTLLYVSTYILGSFIWSLWVVSLNERSKIKSTDCLVLMSVYFFTNLQKYIPGNIFQFVGRNLKGNKYGFCHKSLISASFLEVIVSIGSGLLFVLLLTPFFWGEVQQIVTYFNIGTMILISFVLFFITLLAVFVFFKDKLFYGNKSILRVKKYSKIFYISIFSFLITFALFGLINLILFNNFFDIAFTLQNFAIFSFGFSISWLVGFTVPGSPGGIIVREAVFVLILNSLIAEKELIYVVIYIRFIGIAIEIMLFLTGWLYLIRKKILTEFVS